MTPTLEPRANRRRTKAKPGKPRRVLRFFLSLLILFVLAVCLYIANLYWKLDKALDENISTQPDAVVPKEQQADVKSLSILLLGLDSRAKLGTMNTDVMMVVTMNPKTKSATIVSIPRDAYFELEGYRPAKANGYYAAFYTNKSKKDTAERRAYAYEEMKLMLSRYLDIPIDYVSTIDFDGFRRVVDKLGGIDIYVDMDMRYVDNADGTNIDLKKGQQHLDGKQTLDFVRYRQSNPGKNATKPSNDLQRNQRQNAVLREIAGKMKSLGGLTKLDGIIDAVGDNWKTDLPPSQIKKLLTTYIGIDNERIEYIPVEGTWRSPYIHVNRDSLDRAKAALSRQLNGEFKTGD